MKDKSPKRPKIWPIHAIYTLCLVATAISAARTSDHRWVWAIPGVLWVVSWVIRARRIRQVQLAWDKGDLRTIGE